MRNILSALLIVSFVTAFFFAFEKAKNSDGRVPDQTIKKDVQNKACTLADLILFKCKQRKINEATIALANSTKNEQDKKIALARLQKQQNFLLTYIQNTIDQKMWDEYHSKRLHNATTTMQSALKRMKNGQLDKVTQRYQKEIVSIFSDLITCVHS